MPADLPATIEATVDVSLDGSGDFDGPNDDVTGSVAAEPGIAFGEGKDGARSLSPPKVASLDFELYNDDGSYSLERPDSLAYQQLLPGRPVRLTVRHGARRLYRSHVLYRDRVPYRGLAVHTMARTAIDTISQTTQIANRRIRISTLGLESLLVRSTISVPVSANVRVDQAISLVLDAAGWPADQRQISVADTSLLYFWVDERAPWPVLLELLAAEGPGAIYVKNGVFHFENRNYRTIEPRATTSRATLYDRVSGARTRYREHVLYRGNRLYRGRTSGLYFTEFRYQPGYENVYNRSTYTTRRRTLGALAVIWQYGTTLTLSAGQSITLIARPQTPFQNAVTPQSGTDYTVSSGSLSSVTLSATSGLVAFLTLTAGGSGATVTGLQIRAQPLTVVSETTIENSIDAAASIATYSPIPGQNIPRTLALQGWPEIDPIQAEAVCNAWVSRYMDRRPQISLTLRNADAAHLRLLIELTVSDRLTVVEANTGLSADVWVESKQLRISGAGGRVVECVLGCELAENLSGAVWDESLWDNLAAVWGS
jgi:hypothetical protein